MKNDELVISDGIDTLEFITTRKHQETFIDAFNQFNHIYCLNRQEAQELRDYLDSVLGDK